MFWLCQCIHNVDHGRTNLGTIYEFYIEILGYISLDEHEDKINKEQNKTRIISKNIKCNWYANKILRTALCVRIFKFAHQLQIFDVIILKTLTFNFTNKYKSKLKPSGYSESVKIVWFS